MDFISSRQVAMDSSCTRASREERESMSEVEGQHLALATGSMFLGEKEASLPAFGILVVFSLCGRTV
jgi:hypothetical protein